MHLCPAAPDRRVSRSEFVAAPRHVRLLAALTLTGRLGGRTLLSCNGRRQRPPQTSVSSRPRWHTVRNC
jgi:hypothetical protein